MEGRTHGGATGNTAPEAAKTAPSTIGRWRPLRHSNEYYTSCSASALSTVTVWIDFARPSNFSILI